MKVEVLVSTVNANVQELVKKMKIDSDAIIINQCDKYAYEELKLKDYTIKVFHCNERGVGLSRNTALERATADIVLFADDDEILVDNYEKLIIEEFNKNKKITMLVFNINSINGKKTYMHKNNLRLHKFNSLKYGTVRLAVKLNEIRKNNICFSLLFGGGAKYGSGEDSIFIYDCLKNKLKIYTSDKIIANVNFETSSWFAGYNEKYYFDKGALFYCLHKKNAILFMFIYIIRHKNENNMKFFKKYKILKKGYLEMKKG